MGGHFADHLLIKHIRFGDCQNPFLDKKFGVVFPQFVQQDFVALPDVVRVGRQHKEQDGVALDVSEEADSYAFAFVRSFNDSGDVCHHE